MNGAIYRVDLLPDRRAPTLARWLAEHPGVEVLARDRSGEYAQGAAQGAPDAIQMADCFHRIRNVADVTRRVLQRPAPILRQLSVPGHAHPGWTRLRLDRPAERERTQAAMRELFDQVHALAARGRNRSASARTRGIQRHTVQKDLAVETVPERQHSSRQQSLLALYVGSISERWHHGERNAMALWRTARAEGYVGSYHHLSRLTGHLWRQERLGLPLPQAPPGLTPRQAVGLLLTRQPTPAEQRTVSQVTALHPELQAAATLLAQVIQLLRTKKQEDPAQRLEQWMAAPAGSGLPEFRAFVVKLRQDVAAVVASLTFPSSQGQTEGQINRLKTIKRSVYGHTKFDLLRQRVLLAAA